MSRSRIAGTLELSCDGLLQAVLRDWWLEDGGVAFTMELPLPLEVLHHATPGLAGRPRTAEAADAVLEVLWAPDQASQAYLRIPPPNAAVGRLVAHPPGGRLDPTLGMTRSHIRAGQWLSDMTFAPLPDSGDLGFQLTSRVLGIRRAVDLVSVERLRSRIM